MKKPTIVKNQDFSNKKIFSRFQFLFSQYKEGKILDLGNLGGVFGEGKSNSFHHQFVESVPKSTVYGFDLYKPKNYDRYPHQKSGDIEEGLPYKDVFFDTVYMGELLEHLNNPGHVLSEIHRVLKNDGVFILDIPNPYNIRRIIKFLIQREENLGDPTHLIFYTPASLKAILNKNDFKIKELNTKILRCHRWLPNKILKGLGSHLLVVATKSNQSIQNNKKIYNVE